MAQKPKRIEKRPIQDDPRFEDPTVVKFINQLMRRGKKSVARKNVYRAFDLIKEKTKKDPLEVFEKALKNTSPLMEVRPKRIGGATYQIPIPVKGERKTTLAMRWVIQAARANRGKPMEESLAQELMNASNNQGRAVKKKKNIHRMAEANKAFAHFAW